MDGSLATPPRSTPQRSVVTPSRDSPEGPPSGFFFALSRPQSYNRLMSPPDYSHYTLGSDSGPIAVHSRDEICAANLALTQQARRSLALFSYNLDPRIYDTQEFCDALRQLATASRYSNVRILLRDSTTVVKQGSRVIELMHRISSRILVRKPPPEFYEHNEEFLIADDRGLLFRRFADRHDGELNFNAPNQCRLQLKFFDECWEASAADPELRRLHL